VSTLAKELDRTGLPTVVVTALPTIARLVGANRVLRGVAITNPTGDPRMPPADEFTLRVRLLRRALEMLATDVEPGSIWELPE
jgi:glycine/betaine/sarcosine/D-proline reductase family selenoprotein B